jgi:hypothetical protein
VKGRKHLENLDICAGIILKRTLNEYFARMRIAFIWLRIISSEGFCEYGDELSGSFNV